MFYLPKPNFSIINTYPICVELVTDDNIRTYLQNLSQDIFSYALEYEYLGQNKRLNELLKYAKFSPEIDDRNKWLLNLYNYYFAKSTNERSTLAHGYYKRLFSYETDRAVRRCCYCNANKIDALDHFLPESKYHALSVNPMNLVPACEHCNKKKKAYEPNPNDSRSVLIHPYYDNILNLPWLKVSLTPEVIKGIKRVRTNYYINHQVFMDDEVLYGRISTTLKNIKLNDNICHIADDFVNTEVIPDFVDGEYAEKSEVDLRMLFSKKADRLRQQGYGLNHWKVAIYSYLSTHPGNYDSLY
ncbi:hypothetical protein [uncultured Pantoea sp.]|uniref:HNH endonuclease n=1 Tax=uncultured Pantoea sp. TaxID=218084 RepID=UPI0025D05907|nr:hypothetical protein [uncultured Pantoea sp.]